MKRLVLTLFFIFIFIYKVDAAPPMYGNFILSNGISKITCTTVNNAGNMALVCQGDISVTANLNAVNICDENRANCADISSGILKSSGKQVNLLTNSGFEVASQSTLENVGSQVTLTDVTSGVCASANTQGLAFGELWNFDSGDFNGETYEITAITPNTSFTLNDTSLTDSGSPGTGYEVTPGFVAANGNAFDGWAKSTNGDFVYREHNGNNTKDGSFYSAKFIASGATSRLVWQITKYDDIVLASKFSGRTSTSGCWVKTDGTASAVILQAYDNDETSYQTLDTCTTSSDWQWLEGSYSWPSDSSGALPFAVLVASGETVYISQPMLVLGSYIGEGNYQPIVNEWIWLEAPFELTSYGSSSVSATTAVNLEAESNGKIPKGAIGGIFGFYATCATAQQYITLGGNWPANTMYTAVATKAEANVFTIALDSNGDTEITRNDTFTSIRIKPIAIQLR